MTPFGHIGGSIIIASVVEKYIIKGEITPTTLAIAGVIGLAPDADALLGFAMGKWTPGKQQLPHHQFPTHTPLFFLLLGLGVLLIMGWKPAVMFLALTFGHLLMDSWSTDDGIRWLWPVDFNQYSLFAKNIHQGGLFGLQFYVCYFLTPQTAFPELLLFVFGTAIFVWVIIKQKLFTL